MSHVTVLLVDDHPVVRAGLAALLATQPDIDVVAQATSGTEALVLAARHAPQVVLMDLRMPGMDGATTTRRLAQQCPGTRVVVLTTYDSDVDILRAVEAGAVGYLLKDVPHGELFAAVRAAAQGGRPLAPQVAQKLQRRSMAAPSDLLTARELAVLTLVARGLNNRVIAGELQVSESTVKAHLARVLDKLGVHSRTAAVMQALAQGLIRPP